MRASSIAVAALLIVTACGSATSSDPRPADAESAEMMASALEKLVTKDHTFGEGPPPFTEYLIEVNTVPITLPSTPDSPDSVEKSSDSTRPLSEGEQAAIEAAITELGSVRWIEDPDEWRLGLEPRVVGSVILGVDAPTINGDEGLVPVSLWCGGDCGTWFIYRLEHADGIWRVVGIEGPIAIS